MKTPGGLSGADPHPARTAQPTSGGWSRPSSPSCSESPSWPARMVFTDTMRASLAGVFADAERQTDALVRGPATIEGFNGTQHAPVDESMVEQVAGLDGVEQVAAARRGLRPGRRAGRRGRRRHRHGRRPRRCRLDRRRAAQPVHLVDRPRAARRRRGRRRPVAGRRGRPGAGRPDDRADRRRTGRRDRGRRRDASATPTTGPATAPCCSRSTRPSGCSAAPAPSTASRWTPRPASARPSSPAASAAALGGDLEVVTGTALEKENSTRSNEDVDFFGIFMRVFAAVALLVGAFIINNTFAILVAQRTKELALLRAIGASSRQVRRSVAIEAAVVGVVASAARPARRRRRGQGHRCPLAQLRHHHAGGPAGGAPGVAAHRRSRSASR